MAPKGLTELVQGLRAEYPEVGCGDGIDFGWHLNAAEGVMIGTALLRNHEGYDKPYVEMRFLVLGEPEDRAFLEEIYEEGTQNSSENHILIGLTLDEFKASQLQVDYAYSMSAQKSVEVFMRQSEKLPLGRLVKEDIEFEYTVLGSAGPRIQVSASAAYSKALMRFQEELGLRGFIVEFSGEDYIKMKSRIPEKFRREDISREGFEEVPLTAWELVLAEKILNRSILPDNIPSAQYFSVLHKPKTRRTHIKAVYRNIDLEGEPEKALELITQGFEILKTISINQSELQHDYDVDQMKGAFEFLLHSAGQRSAEDGEAAVVAFLNCFAIDKRNLDLHAKYLIQTQDVDTLTDWYLGFLRSKTCPVVDDTKIDIAYQAESVPISSLQEAGDILNIVCKTKDYKRGEGLTTGGFSIAKYSDLFKSGSFHDIRIVVSLTDPALLETQQKILDMIGVSFS